MTPCQDHCSLHKTRAQSTRYSTNMGKGSWEQNQPQERPRITTTKSQCLIRPIVTGAEGCHSPFRKGSSLVRSSSQSSLRKHYRQTSRQHIIQWLPGLKLPLEGRAGNLTGFPALHHHPQTFVTHLTGRKGPRRTLSPGLAREL